MVESRSDEVRRLRAENRLLTSRLFAFERSRWWRLHPRLAWKRLRPERRTQPRAERSSHVEPPGADPITDRFRTEVVARGAFEKDWFTGSIRGLHPIVNQLESRAARILEIGSFEGLSTCYFLWRLREARLTCVDTFRGSPEHEHLAIDERMLRQTFDRNVALVDPTRVRKIVGDSRRVLLDLLEEEADFDFVYVDGSHAGLDVLVDAALSWQLLAAGGFLVFDDYTWTLRGHDPLVRPGPAIDAFLGLVEGKHEVVLRGGQLGLRKLPA